jgi:enoyl-CoA hydratase
VSVDVERDAGVAVVTVDRPDAMNALDVQHAEELHRVLADLAGDGEARVVVLTGAGEKAFIAGADIKYMQSLGVHEGLRWAELGQACAELLETIPKPTIAAINGYALGGGCELALACDIRLASATAKLGQPEINLGILPGWGGSQRLPRTTTLGFAKELVFTGRMVTATEALERGLVNAVHEPGELMARAREVAEVLASKSPIALAAAKEATNRAFSGDHRDNLRTEAHLFSMAFATEDQKEGMAAFVEKRQPRFSGR